MHAEREPDRRVVLTPEPKIGEAAVERAEVDCREPRVERVAERRGTSGGGVPELPVDEPGEQVLALPTYDRVAEVRVVAAVGPPVVLALPRS